MEPPMIDRCQDCKNRDDAGAGGSREDAKIDCKSLKLLGILLA